MNTIYFQDLIVSQLPIASKATTRLRVATRSDGGTWHLPFLYVTGAQDGPTLLVIAGVHGDEYEGVEAIPRIFYQIQPSALQGQLLMIPVCNMPAYEAGTRNSPIDGLNLARVFPGAAEGTITRRIAFLLTERLLAEADFFIDLHSGGLTYKLPRLIGYIHSYDELGQQSLAGAKAFGASVLWGHPPPLPPGRSISSAMTLGMPSLYTEALGGGQARAEDVDAFVQEVLNVMKYLGMLEGTPRPSPPYHHLVGSGDLDEVIPAPVAGYFRAEVDLLDNVTAGQRLGFIQDLTGDILAEIMADRTGVVIMLRRIHRVQVGDGLVHLAVCRREIFFSNENNVKLRAIISELQTS